MRHEGSNPGLTACRAASKTSDIATAAHERRAAVNEIPATGLSSAMAPSFKVALFMKLPNLECLLAFE
jgi:hypothetical protein